MNQQRENQYQEWGCPMPRPRFFSLNELNPGVGVSDLSEVLTAPSILKMTNQSSPSKLANRKQRQLIAPKCYLGCKLYVVLLLAVLYLLRNENVTTHRWEFTKIFNNLAFNFFPQIGDHLPGVGEEAFGTKELGHSQRLDDQPLDITDEPLKTEAFEKITQSLYIQNLDFGDELFEARVLEEHWQQLPQVGISNNLGNGYPTFFRPSQYDRTTLRPHDVYKHPFSLQLGRQQIHQQSPQFLTEIYSHPVAADGFPAQHYQQYLKSMQHRKHQLQRSELPPQHMKTKSKPVPYFSS